MKALKYDITPWPERLAVREVVRHKSLLIQQSRHARELNDRDYARVAASGASFWERWLLEHDPGEMDEARAVSALELARNAGDWAASREVLRYWRASGRPPHKRFVREWEKLVEAHLPAQSKADEELRRAIDGFLASPRDPGTGRTLEARIEAVTAVASPAGLCLAKGMLHALPRAFAEAEVDFTRLLVCRPLDVRVVARLGQVQVERDPASALATITEAVALIGPDWKLVVLRAFFAWQAWAVGGRPGSPPVQDALAAQAAVAGQGTVSPSDQRITALASLTAAFALVADGRTAEAISLLWRAAAEQPHNGDLWTVLGMALLAAGDRAGASQALARARRSAEPGTLLSSGIGDAVTEALRSDAPDEALARQFFLQPIRFFPDLVLAA